NAAKLRILQYLNRHQHFVEGADMYSVADECEICAGNGFYCEMCDDADKRDEVRKTSEAKLSACYNGR
ncbi:hypothetical protein ANCDUO_25401, partial [Ancylostoma duodenale]